MSFPSGAITRWKLGFSAADVAPHDGIIAFNAAQLAAAPGSVGLHEALTSLNLPRAPTVEVRLPGYRGKALVGLLNWLVVERLVTKGGTASFLLDKQQGPASLVGMLGLLGWRDVTKKRIGNLHRVSGVPPETARPPETQHFTTVLGGHGLTFAAGYGVFSPGHVDEGTRLLADVALSRPAVPVVADIGIGYGPLAVALVRGGAAGRAVATDVDCIALWLARRNALANGVDLRTECIADPGKLEDTPLTVCNVPTHIDACQTAALVGALAGRAEDGRSLLLVVHASLEARYLRYFADAGLPMSSHPGSAHVVLSSSG